MAALHWLPGRWAYAMLLQIRVRESETRNFHEEVEDTGISWQDHGQCVWDSEEEIHVDFHPQCYSNLLRSIASTEQFRKKRHGKLSQIVVILHDGACPHMADLMKAILTTGYHSYYSPDLVSSDFHLFVPMKVHPGGQKL
jgi:hypothetical protein